MPAVLRREKWNSSFGKLIFVRSQVIESVSIRKSAIRSKSVCRSARSVKYESCEFVGCTFNMSDLDS